MNGRMKWMQWVALAVCGLVWMGQAQAALVSYEKVGFIKDTGYFSDAFTIDTAGSYKVTLTDFKFPSLFDQLALDVTTAADTKGSLAGPGSFVFQADPGTYYASLYGVGGGALNLGLFGVQVESFIPTNADPAPVPLPAALMLLLSGLVVLAQMSWRRRPKHDEFVTKESYSSVMV